MRLVQLASSTTDVVASERDLATAADAFVAADWIRLEGFVEPGFLSSLQSLVEEGSFERIEQGDIAVEDTFQPGSALYVLQFLANDPSLFALVERVTGCGRIGCFSGRIYRFAPGGDHRDSWHDDMAAARLVALSVNLSRDAYDGADLELANRRTGIVQKVENRVPGDAILFRLADHLMHRNTPLLGSRPKTAYAGWFRREPSFREALGLPARSGLV
jgi:hypothetical protein